MSADEVYEVGCPICDVSAGEACVEFGALVRDLPHVYRLHAAQTYHALRPFAQV